MNILFRYMFRQYAKIFGLCLLVLVTVYEVVDFFEKLRKFLKYEADISFIAAYFLYKVPEITFTLAPLAALMATLLSIGTLNKNKEITAMRSCGISNLQIAAPFVTFGALLSGLLFICTAVVIPMSNLKANYIKRVLIEQKSEELLVTPDKLWIRLDPYALLQVESVEPQGARLHQVHFFRMAPGFRLQEVIQGDRAVYGTGRQWTLENAVRRRLDAQGRVVSAQYEALPFPLPLTPEDFRTWLAVEPKNMTLMQLATYIERVARDGHDTDWLVTEYWGRIAFSTVALNMTMLGLGLGLLHSRTRGATVTKGVGQALGIGFVFWVIHSLGIVLGRNGTITPLVAAWIASAMFFAIGLKVFLQAR
ncbi:MAG: LPS export ABC transporter permease LptG [Nitrospirae bacterium]|nr:MAG: LPS export ABC transporter permease LptG [Nitrospirota bacterium]